MDSLMTLFDENLSLPDVPGLLPALQAVYGGDLVLPSSEGQRPYIIANFVASIDGIVSFNLPQHDTGGAISGGSEIDHAVMGILRSMADAVMWGSKTYQVSQRFVPTPAAIWRAGADQLQAQRVHLGKTAVPIAVIVTASGEIAQDGAIFQRPEQPAIVATTEVGAARLADLARTAPNVRVWSFGATVPLAALAQRLHAECGVQTLLCEGGPALFGGLLAAGMLDELFLTRAPQLVGRASDAPRPSLVESMAFTPATAPWLRLLSLKRSGSHLFERYVVAK